MRRKLKIGDKVLVTYQYDIEDRTRAEGVIVEMESTSSKLSAPYKVRCDANPLMTGWYSRANLELIPKTDECDDEIGRNEKSLQSDKSVRREIRKVGDIMLDMEKLLFELHLDHDLQHGEVLALINGWQKIHAPGQIETYEDLTHPVLYGPGVSENRCDLPMIRLSPAQIRKGRTAIKALARKVGRR